MTAHVRPPSVLAAALAASLALVVAVGCSSSRESAEADKLTAHVGNYPPGPSPAWRPRVGVPEFKVSGGDVTKDTAAVAADQLTTLSISSDRFAVIERAQLAALLQEPGLGGVVKDGEVAKPSAVRGVDLLFLGKITNFRVKAEKTKDGFNLAGIGGKFAVFDINNSKSSIKVECGVDIRLVDPSSGEIFEGHFGEFTRTDTLEAMGVGVLGYRSQTDATLEMDKDNQGKVLRLALDEAMRKLLPKVDRKLAARAPKP